MATRIAFLVRSPRILPILLSVICLLAPAEAQHGGGGGGGHFGAGEAGTLQAGTMVVGTTLVFGVLRKELSMIMLVQALGTTAIHQAMTTCQILVFTIFIAFYIPCLARIAHSSKRSGGK